MSATEYALGSLALVLALPHIASLSTFLQSHLLKRCTINTYFHSPQSYALVTGASDGIGKGVATELVRRGLNVIIHGRNRQKLEGVKQELEALGKGTDIRILVADASDANVDWARIDNELKGLEITLLVNNAGGMPIPSVPFDAQPWENIEGVIRLNALFAMRLTHLLIGRMRSLPSPTAVLFIGSIASELPPPYMAAYGCSKSFLQALAKSLSFDERRSLHSKVEIHYVQTANVKTHNGVHEKASWDTPDAESYGRAVVRIVGVKTREVCPWWVHAVQRWTVYSMGERMAENVMLMAMPAPKKD